MLGFVKYSLFTLLLKFGELQNYLLNFFSFLGEEFTDVGVKQSLVHSGFLLDVILFHLLRLLVSVPIGLAAG